jgi:tRNA-specific 2-thiouridylase
VIAKLRPDAARPGEVVDLGGRVLGHHEGIIHFTVGQRRGLKLAVGEPLYVVRLEPETARVVVGPRSALATGRVRLTDLNWLGSQPVESLDGLEVAVRVRSTREPRPARLAYDAAQGSLMVDLATPEDGVSPGQACVIYADEDPRARVLGGGTIARVDTVSAHPAQAA